MRRRSLRPAKQKSFKRIFQGESPSSNTTFILTHGYGCFRKWWYPQIIQLNRDFHSKSSIWGTPVFGNTHMAIWIKKVMENITTFSWVFPKQRGIFPRFSRQIPWSFTPMQRWKCLEAERGVTRGDFKMDTGIFRPLPEKRLLCLKDVLLSLIDMPSFFWKASVLVS